MNRGIDIVIVAMRIEVVAGLMATMPNLSRGPIRSPQRQDERKEDEHYWGYGPAHPANLGRVKPRANRKMP